MFPFQAPVFPFQAPVFPFQEVVFLVQEAVSLVEDTGLSYSRGGGLVLVACLATLVGWSGAVRCVFPSRNSST
ncbi:hypothetical protein Atai01_82640 [Amycolatopsis taiwanensis]|uniref:Uncharacterized protein n=1 Tax=Amycolatopsis taiwanensis TaxID=342230 RepID=A0A9W6VKF7_9PSEU|nr:hypothetical protein Atai01_82640 [Amycolatopsis taiwanensis]